MPNLYQQIDEYAKLKALPREEYLKYRSHLKNINRPEVTTFKDKFDDIVGCVEYHKQISLAGPLSEDELQAEDEYSTSTYESRFDVINREESTEDLSLFESCPNGTIPVSMIPMRNLLSAPSLDKYGKKYPDGYTKELHEYLWGDTYSSYQDFICRTSWRHPQVEISSKSAYASRTPKDGISSNSSASPQSEIPSNSAHPLQESSISWDQRKK
ncbi:hypothetical protein CKAN_00255500 [Cinnamomum micranthum f. kanehirae]|uniref:Uncharacterized protein n=1 Tax=Cinnamomum micranthum f. kanehirae TaxID=337451 RepID=A0A3S3LZE6_9MAGN|nr:hypothetical protein CKAN_00255500 [Cinnamomum micranthum f. kanehirae]